VRLLRRPLQIRVREGIADLTVLQFAVNVPRPVVEIDGTSW
jgi:hypothetical protein